MDAFVTCIYNGLYHTGYGGRNMRDARYRESLINIANTGVKIFCYTSSNNLPTLQTQFASCSNIELKVWDLTSFDFSEAIQRIKNSNREKYSDIFWTQRCVEIMWGKFFMIQDVLNTTTYKNVYWIDAGLFHNDVLSPKYFLNNKPELKGAGLPLFNPFLMHKLERYADGKLIIAAQTNPHNKPINAKYNETPYRNHFGAVGGFFGGDSEKMKIVCESFISKMRMLLADEELCSEESILSGVVNDHADLFKPFVFQSWYHEGWAERHDPHQSTFSSMFDAILDRDRIEDGLVFVTLAAGGQFIEQSKILIKSFLDHVKGDISLMVFTDHPNEYPDYGPRIIIEKFDVPCTNCAFHYGFKYKVIQMTHQRFEFTDKIFYLDADCYFVTPVSKQDFIGVQPGFNISLGNPSSQIVNPGIQRKYKAIAEHVGQVITTNQFRECAMTFHITDKHIFNRFLGEWQLLYEFTRDNGLALSGEYIEITYACLRSGFPLVSALAGPSFRNLRNSLRTVILNNSTQAIF